MDVIVERPGALDVHNASVVACVRLPGEKGRRDEQVAEFSTTTRGLLALHDWLRAHGVRQVAMEATGSYWKPIWAVLEDDFECLLVNARHVKQVPGRKTDLKVPPKPIRTLRNLTRYRKSQIRDRQREANRLHKVMQETGIKLDCVASDLLGKSGRAMLDALVAGTTDPEVLADLARGQTPRSCPRSGKRSTVASAQSTRWSSAGSSPTSTSSTSRSRSSRRRSSSRSPLSPRRLSSCARSPVSDGVPPR